MRRFRTWRRARQMAAVFVASAGVAACLASCQAGPGDPQRREAPPSSAPSASSSPTVAASPSETTPAPAATASPAGTRPALPPEAQAELDQRLIKAAKANDAALVGQLIRTGGNVNAKDAIQDSAFLYAGAEGFNEVLQLTLAAGADVRSTNRFGGTALIPASEHGHVDTVRILIAAGVPVDHVNNLGWTALLEAIILGDGGPRHTEVVRLLVNAGADVNLADSNRVTPLAHAQQRGYGQIADILLKAGAR